MIRLNIDTAKFLAEELNKLESSVDLMQGRYVVDAKSIMGIFSLNLTEEIKLRFHGDNIQERLEFEAAIKHILTR